MATSSWQRIASFVSPVPKNTPKRRCNRDALAVYHVATVPAADSISRSIEQQLVIACARGAATASDERIIFPESFDWEAAHAFADLHRLSPMFTLFLRGERAVDVPPQVRVDSESRLRPFMTRSLTFTGELIRITRALGAEVTLRAEKGPALAERAYGTTVLRDFEDLDLYVPKCDVVRAGELLTAAGYAPKYAFTDAELELHLAANCELEYIRREPPVTVDLHWEAVPPFLPYRIPSLAFERSASVRIGGEDIPTFLPVDAVLVQCLSAAKDLWCRLEPLLALSSFVARSAVDLDEVMRVATTAGCRSIVKVTLRLADLHFGLDVSAKVRLSAPEEAAVARLAQRPYRTPPLQVGARDVVRELYRLTDRRSELVRSCFKSVFTPTVGDVLAGDRSRGTAYLYLTRPFRLLGKRLRRSLARRSVADASDRDSRP